MLLCGMQHWKARSATHETSGAHVLSRGTENSCLQEAVRETLWNIREACRGLVDFLQQLRDSDATDKGEGGSLRFLEALGEANGSQGESLRSKLSAAVQDMESVDWLVPPMLQKR